VTLEDHVGDIIRKARRAAGLSAEAVAQAAGWSPVQLSETEETGRVSQRPDWKAIGTLVGLHAGRLEAIAEGWRPSEKDLKVWRELRVVTSVRGGNTVNSYLVWDEVSREAALFDTGWDAQPVLALVGEQGLHLEHLFLTHSHEDHVAAQGALRAWFPKLLLHTSAGSAPPQHRNRPNDFIHLGSLRITNRKAPGHAEDGVIYIVSNWPEDAPPAAIVGDTLFAGSLATGFVSTELLKQTVREQVFTLPTETLLCPGHGPLTSVAEEKAQNPFFS